MQRIIFFTAGDVPTVEETADIAKLKSAAAAPYEVLVVNSREDSTYGAGRLIPGDLVAGAVPSAYEVEVESERVYPEIDPDAIPASLPEGSTIGLIDGGATEATATINADGKAELSGDVALLEDGQAIAGTGGTFTPTVVDGEITGGTWVAA